MEEGLIENYQSFFVEILKRTSRACLLPAINPYFNGSLLIEMNKGLNRVHNHIMLER